VRAVVIAALVACAGANPAQGRAPAEPLADGELADVYGADGLAFNLRDFSLAGMLTLTYTTPDGGASLALANIALSRSDDPSATFSDPYRLNLITRPGAADVVRLSEPLNAAGLLKWQSAFDWSVNANGQVFQGGALVLQDLVARGGSLSLTTPATPGVEGVTLGMAVNVELGSLHLRPRGRDNDGGELSVSGLRLRAAQADGTLLDGPWVLADVTRQPGILNAITTPSGSAIHFGIGWPTTSEGAPLAGLVVDKIQFRSGASLVDFGSSRIGTMQIQYLDMTLRPGS
jgi:hypothetical protein